MKKFILMGFILLVQGIMAQTPSPTLGIGLEALTFNKGTINVEVLTKIILKKQRELKNEALKRFMFKMFPESDYTTRFYVQNCLNILLNEKNPQVIEKEILELTTNYAIALGVTQAVNQLKVFENSGVKKNKHVDYEKIRLEIKFKKSVDKLDSLIGELHKVNEKLFNEAIDKEKEKHIDEIKCIEKQIKSKKRQLARNGVKYDLTAKENNNKPQVNINQLTFGEKLDLVSLALSDNELLKKKGFFKNRIDYQADQGYFISLEKDTKIKDSITNTIKPFIENYDIIKNFLETNEIKKDVKNIKDELTKIYANQINLFNDINNISNNNELIAASKEVIDSLNKRLKDKDELRKYYKLINNYNSFQIDTLKPLIILNDSLKNNELDQFSSILKSNRKIISLVKNFKSTITNINEKKIITTNFNINEKEIGLINDLDVNIRKIENIYVNDTIIQVNYIIINRIIEDINSNIESSNKILSSINSKEKIDFSVQEKMGYGKIDSLIKVSLESISKTPIFFKVFIDNLLNKIENEEIKQAVTNATANINHQQVSLALSKIYERLNYFRNNKNFTISDINYLEKELLPQLVGLKFTESKDNQIFYNDLIKGLKNLTPLLKIRILSEKKLNIDLSNSENLLSLFEFIGNLDKLDKAQTYASIIDLIQKNSEEISNVLPDGEFKDSYKIFINGVKKYTLINPTAEKQYVEIDVVSFLDDLQQYYNRKNPSKFSLYLTIGLNQNFFFKDFQFPDSQELINNIGFASEKLGVKIRLHDFKRVRNYENVIKSDVYLNHRAPFINEIYMAIYGSGLLYSLANTATNKNFNFPHVGLSTGIRFYNALDLNLMLGFPFVKNQPFGNNAFFGIGFDVPLGEYLEALGNK